MNKLICDMDSGVCGVESDVKLKFKNLNNERIDLYYFTDPICSHCYLIEPIFKKFTHIYQDNLNIKIVMGGLLQKWDDFSDSSNDVAKPSDVYYHWQEVAKRTELPIDGRLWLDNYITSSFPASEVYEAIKKIDLAKANIFLRKARIATFAFNQNISDDGVLINLVNDLDLDGRKIVLEQVKEKGQELLDEGFYTARSFGVTGYPTVIMVNKNNDGIVLVGSRPFESYLEALNELITNKNDIRTKELPTLKEYLKENHILFYSDIQFMYNLEPKDVDQFIENNLEAIKYKTGEVLNKKYIELLK